MTEYTGNISFFGERDVYSAALVAGRLYYVEVEGYDTNAGTLDDPILDVSLGGSFVTGDDDGGVGFNSRAVFVAGATGNYTFGVEAYAGLYTGSYRLRINEDDFRNSVEGNGGTGFAGNTRGAQTGEINYSGDTDLYRTQLIQGLTYIFSERGAPTGDGTLPDTLLRLVDNSDAALAGNDDNGGTLNSRFAYTAGYSGFHYLQAGAYFNGTGTYSVNVSAGRGTNAANTIVGTAYADAVEALGGNDSVRGLAGADRLTGGAGADRMFGGTGADTFVYNAASESINGARDIILGGNGAIAFEGAGVAGGDFIDLEAIDANVNLAGDQDFIIGGNGIQRLSFVSSGTDTLVRGNIDGDAAFEFAFLIRDARGGTGRLPGRRLRPLTRRNL